MNVCFNLTYYINLIYLNVNFVEKNASFVFKLCQGYIFVLIFYIMFE